MERLRGPPKGVAQTICWKKDTIDLIYKTVAEMWVPMPVLGTKKVGIHGPVHTVIDIDKFPNQWKVYSGSIVTGEYRYPNHIF